MLPVPAVLERCQVSNQPWAQEHVCREPEEGKVLLLAPLAGFLVIDHYGNRAPFLFAAPWMGANIVDAVAAQIRSSFLFPVAELLQPLPPLS